LEQELKDSKWLSGKGQIKLAVAEGVSLKTYSEPNGGSLNVLNFIFPP
jgi:hypothetical protein